MPGTRQDYWRPKLERNVERDAAAIEQLRELGWQVLTVWECDMKNAEPVKDWLRAFLDSEQETAVHG